jgi:hypothetical protein
VAAIAAKLSPAAALLFKSGCVPIRTPLWHDPVGRDTFNGLIAFVVPGPDRYSLHQGVSTVEPGGIDAGILETLIVSLDELQPPPPPFGSLAGMTIILLNSSALMVNALACGPFASAFAKLSFREKARVFASMERDPLTAPLAGALFTFVAFFAYSEVGVFDEQTQTLNGQPVGWANAGFDGVSWGHAEFKGYFEDRRSVVSG